ncbi:cadherin EGF LAG seven-pass G-type receptor 2-like [Tubulanus polymorphus]|uniref:cadherin EGF LAG seven-pass G-type receptor 2-like n=1 Tax=Tubulanus polymorphus TaxID=672921 RepID=UPI003DA2F815
MQYFYIHPNTGRLTTTKPVLAAQDLYRLVISAADPKSRTSYAVAIVRITHDKFKPTCAIPNDQFTIQQSSLVGSPIRTVRATDSDLKGTVEYKLVGSYPAGQFFNISTKTAQTGEIRIARDLKTDTERTLQYKLLVSTYDSSYPNNPTTCTVLVTVTRNTGGPQYTKNIFEITIPETQPLKSYLLNVSATDPDNDEVIYGIAPPATPLFSINPDDGRIFLEQPLSGTTTNRFQFTVNSRDNGAPPTNGNTAFVIVNVLRNAQPPQWQRTFYTGRIIETDNITDKIVQVVATDPDQISPGNEVRYSMSQDAASALGRQYFTVDPVTGWITQKAAVLYDVKSNVRYTFNVVTQDLGLPQPKINPIQANVAIDVVRNLAAPVITNVPPGTSRRINRDVAPNSPIMTVTATDADLTRHVPFGTVRFYAIGDDNAAQFFNISTSGDVRVAQALTGTETIYRLRIEARDGGVPPLTAQAVLTLIVDRNLVAPVFSTRSLNLIHTINELHPVGVQFVSVGATDDDPAAPWNTIEYTSNDAIFGVNAGSGGIYLKQSLLGSTPLQYQFDVDACDKGSPAKCANPKARVTINVIRNQNAPMFQPTATTTVPENQALNVPVTSVIAYDIDPAPFNTTRVELIGDVPAPIFFALNPVTGAVTVIQSLATGMDEKYTLRVRATDSGQPALTNYTTIDILVKRNFFTPSWTKKIYNVTIPDTQAFGVPIETLLATDSDTKSPFKDLYFFMTGDAVANPFFMVNEQGQVMVKKSLTTNPSVKNYVVTAGVRDKALNPLTAPDEATVYITVIRNDKCPVFQNTPYKQSIPMNILVGQRAAQVSATDPDVNVS